MRIIRVEPTERPLQLESDEVLQSLMFSLDSGNACTMTPAMKRAEGDRCHIIINYAWVRTPTPDEEQAIHEVIEKMLGKPEFVSAHGNSAEATRTANDWLTSGKKPRTH